jgi:head-tail adaptor
MKTGKLFDIITIYSLTSTENSGDVTETWDEGVECRANVTQVDGSRYLLASELVDKEIYEIELWDNDWSSNILISYLGKSLYPIRPVMRNPDASKRKIVKILAAVKV